MIQLNTSVCFTIFRTYHFCTYRLKQTFEPKLLYWFVFICFSLVILTKNCFVWLWVCSLEIHFEPLKLCTCFECWTIYRFIDISMFSRQRSNNQNRLYKTTISLSGWYNVTIHYWHLTDQCTRLDADFKVRCSQFHALLSCGDVRCICHLLCFIYTYFKAKIYLQDSYHVLNSGLLNERRTDLVTVDALGVNTCRLSCHRIRFEDKSLCYVSVICCYK